MSSGPLALGQGRLHGQLYGNNRNKDGHLFETFGSKQTMGMLPTNRNLLCVSSHPCNLPQSAGAWSPMCALSRDGARMKHLSSEKQQTMAGAT